MAAAAAAAATTAAPLTHHVLRLLLDLSRDVGGVHHAGGVDALLHALDLNLQAMNDHVFACVAPAQPLEVAVAARCAPLKLAGWTSMQLVAATSDLVEHLVMDFHHAAEAEHLLMSNGDQVVWSACCQDLVGPRRPTSHRVMSTTHAHDEGDTMKDGSMAPVVRVANGPLQEVPTLVGHPAIQVVGHVDATCDLVLVVGALASQPEAFQIALR